MIDSKAITKMKSGVMHKYKPGTLIETKAVIGALKSGKIGYLGLDVYEKEGDLFFEDLSNEVILDDVFARLHTFPNVLLAFFMQEALRAIAETTLSNISDFEKTGHCINLITADRIKT